MKINLISNGSNECYIANSSIKINNYKKIILISKENDIIIKRHKALLDFPLFLAENSCLIIGEDNMKGQIKIDGNKNEYPSNSCLIKLIGSEYYQYSNVILRNNWNRSTKKITKSSNINTNKFYGSAINSINSKINIFGGEITDNINEIIIDKNNKESELPEKEKNSLFYCARGAGIYMINNSILNMYNGKIANNKGINNSIIFSILNSTILKDKKSKWENNCKGIGIFANKNCKIILHKGEISNNLVINSGKIFINTSKNGKENKISTINCCIYGFAIFVGNNSYFQMEKDFIIKDKDCELDVDITIEKNNKIKEINNNIKGGQI